MHIVILADPIDKQNAGVYTYTFNIIKALLKFNNSLQKNKQNKYTFIHSKKNPFFNNLFHHIISRGNYPGGESVRRFIKIPKLIKKLKPDYVWELSHIGPFAIPKNIKRILTIHDLTSILFPEHHTFRNTFIHKLLLPRSIKNADIILTPSETTKNDIEQLYSPKAKIHVTPLGADHIKEIATPKTTKKTEKYILFIGTIEPRKNLEILIDAFDELKKSHKIPHQLIIAGNAGWKSKAILKKAHETKDVEIKQNISDQTKVTLYKNAEMLVYPSLYEGFGLPPAEALALGTRVICSTGGALEEIYKDYAIMFNPKDKEKLKSLILKTIKKPNKHISIIINTWNITAIKTLEAILSCNPTK